MTEMPVGGRAFERGETLIEILVAVAILGVGFVALLGGLTDGILWSRVHRVDSNEYAVLLNAAEAVKAADYVHCPADPNPALATALTAVAVPDGWSVAVPDGGVKYWNGSTFVSPSTPICGDLQLVTVEVNRPGNKAVRSLSVTKQPTALSSEPPP